MDIFINLKSVGKRKLEKTSYSLPDGIVSLKQLIETIVKQEVQRYNSRGSNDKLVPFLTEETIADQLVVGKVGFGHSYSEKKADEETMVLAALQGFEDGLFRVVLGQKELLDLHSPLDISQGDVFTFIRLTFLAGQLW